MVWFPDRPLIPNYYRWNQPAYLSTDYSTFASSKIPTTKQVHNLITPVDHLYMANAQLFPLWVTCHFLINQLSYLYLQLRAQLLTLPKSCNCLKHWTVWTLNCLNTELSETLNCLNTEMLEALNYLNTELLEALNYLNTELLGTLNCLKLYAATWLLPDIYRDLPGLNFPPIIWNIGFQPNCGVKGLPT